MHRDVLVGDSEGINWQVFTYAYIELTIPTLHRYCGRSLNG